jgi:hypothetical protein
MTTPNPIPEPADQPTTFSMQQQEADDWCWAAVAVSVNKFIAPNSSLTQGTLASQLLPECNGDPTSAVCNLPASLTQALNLIHRQVADPILSPISFAQIRQTIDSGWPIPVRIVWDDNPGNAHFVVITGYAVSQSGVPLVQVDDPFYDRSIVDYSTFVSSYHGAGQWERTYRVG